MKKITNPEEFEICPFDGMNVSRVYLGGVAELERVILTWRIDKERSEMIEINCYVLTLKEIAEQLREKTDLITVIVQRPLSGEIYQWGNYGDEWRQIGELDGYA